MSVETPAVAPTAPARTPWRRPDQRPRLWPAVAALAVYWAATIIVGRTEKPYFVGFMFGLIAPTLLALFLLGWWWLSRRIRLADRAYGFLIVVAGGLIAWPLAHPSVGIFGLWLMALPVVLKAWVLWMAVGRGWGAAGSRAVRGVVTA